jgi:glycosyltransferase involved in cell wall biosynthesis
LYLALFRPLFHLPRCILFNTEAERELVHRVFGNQQVPSQVVGLGIDPPAGGDPEEFVSRHGFKGPFLLYMGRIDVMKGVDQLFAHFIKLVKEPEFAGLKLVLAGKERMAIPRHPGIMSLGFVPEKEKASALMAATALVTPSPYESLSMVTMEAGLTEKPVLVNQECEVLARYVEQSRAGLAYAGYEGFRQAVRQILAEPSQARAMGQRGRAFVSKRYCWGPVMEIYERVLSQVAGQSGPPRKDAG